MRLIVSMFILTCLLSGQMVFPHRDHLAPQSLLIRMKDHRLFRFLDEYGNNPPEVIARILDFFHGTSSGRPTWLEIGCGDAQVSLEIAKRNPGANVLATDQYRKGDPRTDAYAKVTHDWEQGELQAQQSGLDNISIARAEFNILHEIPDHSLDYLLLINTSTPSALQDLCSYKRLIQQKLKIGGVILWYPYNNPEIYVDVNNHYHFQKTENFSWLEAIIPNLSSWSRSRTRPQTGFMIWTNTPEERPVSRFLSEQETGASA